MDFGSQTEVLERIREGLETARSILAQFTPGQLEIAYKAGSDPVTEADRAVNEALQRVLVRDGEGWLSEESADDLKRLGQKYLWVVDPIDGTREFVAGIPEWCVSIALVEGDRAVAGGICNPVTREMFLGAHETRVQYNGTQVHVSQRIGLEGALVVGSGSEVKRGEWKKFESASFRFQTMGSVAYKLARVAAGLADATWTLVPKHAWDIAAGVALVQAAGRMVRSLNDSFIKFNSRRPLLPGPGSLRPQALR